MYIVFSIVVPPLHQYVFFAICQQSSLSLVSLLLLFLYFLHFCIIRTLIFSQTFKKYSNLSCSSNEVRMWIIWRLFFLVSKKNVTKVFKSITKSRKFRHTNDKNTKKRSTFDIYCTIGRVQSYGHWAQSFYQIKESNLDIIYDHCFSFERKKDSTTINLSSKS